MTTMARLRTTVRLGLLLAGGLILPQAAQAASNTTLGVGSGAVAGALVAGPIGAVAGAIVGGVVGASSERAAPRRYRRARSTRRSALPPRRTVQRSVAAEPRSLTPTMPATTGATGGSTWKDPR
ncbi:hypothetical protein [Methylobacterium trifolii]|uniref:Glycine zipper domain-containing protein n=1 Tax=Methylobacterium trifolii TaxID=1003092 RepID=A0ABQ4TZC3_9HYPH|nr:hypothetical protein [Methylobacterium trifolii]GJE60610.1 hypothetical protein MPOCJGCO_2724 [Methylobacterium trifolii]